MAHQTATSAVDFLTSRGFKSQGGEQFPLFKTRKQLFDRLGLSGTLGEFRGSATQNPALISALARAEKGAGVSITPENVFDIISTNRTTAVEKTTAVETSDFAPVKTLSSTKALPGTPGLADELIPEEQPKGNLAQQALETVLGSATFPLRKEATEAAKETIKLQGQRDVEATIRGFASRGLFFSGAKKAEVSAIEVDTLARQLGVDRKFALLIAQGLESAAQDIAKEAQKGDQRALDALEATGFTIVGGRVVPTLAGRKFVAGEEKAVRVEERAQSGEVRAEETAARLERGEAKGDLRLQLAIESAERSAQAANKPTSRVFTDSEGNVTEILSDPFTGQEIGRINRGKIGKVGSADPLDRFIDALISETLGEFGLEGVTP